MDLVLHGLPKKVPKYVNLKHLGVEIMFEKFKKKLTSIKIVSIKNTLNYPISICEKKKHLELSDTSGT